MRYSLRRDASRNVPKRDRTGLRTFSGVARADGAAGDVAGRRGVVGLLPTNALLPLAGAGVRIEEGAGGQEAQEPWTPWKEAGSRGLDTWFELPGYAVRGGFCGEPGGDYDYSPFVEDRLATLEDEETNEGYCAWLKHALTRLMVRAEA